MDKIDQEVEIKIEYNESFEMDPLCDKTINSAGSVIRKGCVSDEINHLQTYKLKIASHEIKSLNTDIKLDTFNVYSNSLARSEMTWYDSINNSGKYLCKFCDLKYSTLQTIRFHVKSKHPEQARHIKNNLVKCKRNSKLKCHICNERFKELLVLKSHVANKHSLENIKSSCLHCDAVFDTENEMSAHSHIIQNEKDIYKPTYICNTCGYRTATKSHYNQHINTHDGDKNKKCRYCDYATNYLLNLKIHERIHTKDKVYECDFRNCNYQCTAKSALRSHQLKHNLDVNVLYCDKCSYKTVYRQSLKRHNDCHKRNSIKVKIH